MLYKTEPTLPKSAQEITSQVWFKQKYTSAPFVKPSYIEADFNGDKQADVAILIREKKTQKKGIMIVHGKTNAYVVLGAGNTFGAGGDDFSWMDKWQLYTNPTAQETIFNETTGDIIGGKTVRLKHPCVLVADYEDGGFLAGGLIYWNGKKYTWIHQGE